MDCETKKTDFDTNPPVSVEQYDEAMSKFCAGYSSIFLMANAVLDSVLKEQADVLIVGAGTGVELVAFGPSHPKWQFTAVDPSAEMLSIAKRKVIENNIIKQVDFIQGYTDELAQARLFSAATCILVMHFLPDDGSKLQLLSSVAKRLKSGAPFILVDGFGDKDNLGFAQTLAAWKQYVKLLGVDAQYVEDGFNNEILKRLQFVPETRIEELFQEAGFFRPIRFFTGFLYGGWMAIKK